MMKRITFDGLFCDIALCRETPGGSFCENGTCSQRQVWERLRVIENILDDEYDLDHIRDLLQAKKDGRLIVLPVALNEEIWVTAPHLPAPYRTIYVNADGILRDVERGYVFYKTCEEAEAALSAQKGDNHETDPV